MSTLPIWSVHLTFLLAVAPAFAGAPATNAPDPRSGKELASRHARIATLSVADNNSRPSRMSQVFMR